VAKELRSYGIELDGSLLDPSKLPHLIDENLETRNRLEEAIEKEKVGGLTNEQAVQRYVRHVGFTYLNRLAALRAMETRQLITETIIRRSEYGGRSLRERQIAELNPRLTSDQALKRALLETFREVSQEIKVLFDPENEYSLILPDTATIRDVMKLLAEEVSEQDWKEDDIIGWIYQYYNEEARQEFRKAKRRPTADDIPVINQFYTTPWIVKSLVDNTLGRLWLETHPESKLRDLCTYQVPLKNARAPQNVRKAREIKILDPACGSGHFLVYAFDILYHMYQEDEPGTPIDQIPQLILANNLFGIDIDLRAVQLAALSLYIKAKSYNPKTEIGKMNLVCADVRLIDGKKQLEFLDRFKDDEKLQQIFARLFNDVENAYQIGSLLKVKEPFEKLLSERKGQQRQAKLQLAVKGQAELSHHGIAGQSQLVILPSEEEKDRLVMIVPKQRTIQEMEGELRQFELEALEAHDMGRLLFAAEAAKSVGLLSLLSESYDVILMNPPYGDMPAKTKEYLRRPGHYPRTHFDYYGAFIEQTVNLCKPDGFVGMLTSRTFMFLKWFGRVREEILWNDAKPEVLLDLGFNVLDGATGRWAATIVRRLGQSSSVVDRLCVFFRLTPFKDENSKRLAFEQALASWKSSSKHEILFPTDLNDLKLVPGFPYSYWATHSLRKLFAVHPPLDLDQVKKSERVCTAPKIADLVVGLQTGDDGHFIRYFWEVNSVEIGRGKKWVPYARGSGQRFYTDVDFVVLWENNGKEIKEFPRSVVRNESYYFRDGLCWSIIASSTFLEFRVLPAHTIFSVNTMGLFASNEVYTRRLLSFLNSTLAAFLYSMLDPLMHNRIPGELGRLPVAPRVSSSKKLDSYAAEAHDLLARWNVGNEVSMSFTKPWVLQALDGSLFGDRPIINNVERADRKISEQVQVSKGSPTISQLAKLCLQREKLVEKNPDELQRLIDEEVYYIYEISDADRALIDHELKLVEGESQADIDEISVTSEQAGLVTEDEKSRIRDHIMRLLSFYTKRAIESDDDGIIPLNETFSDNLAAKIRQQIIADFGKNSLDEVERELEQILGKSMTDWLAQDFFAFHVSMYKRRPVFWQLTSQRLGRGTGSGVFSCFLHYHKLSRDTIPKVQALYLHEVKDRMKANKEHVYRELAKSIADHKKDHRLADEYERLSNQLEELEKFDSVLTELMKPRRTKTKLSHDSDWVDQAMAEVRDNGWNPVIDYGVRVNIEPLKELGVLQKAADKVT
jgi:hypothetical protein